MCPFVQLYYKLLNKQIFNIYNPLCFLKCSYMLENKNKKNMQV